MNSPDPSAAEPIPAERLAEASVWVARLHGDQRGPLLERSFRSWLRAAPVNAQAFELVTDVWNDAGNLPRVPWSSSPARAGNRLKLVWSSLAAAAVMLCVGIVLHLQSTSIVSTAVGQRQQLVLEDGTRVLLNTATRVKVNYGKKARRVELQSGEAIFDVAKRADWPFVVTAGDQRIAALGTSFLVRHDTQQVAVTLMEGKVVVSPVVAERKTYSTSQKPATARYSSNGARLMRPGQRLTFTTGQPAQLDTPSVEKLTAWRQGQVMMDDTPLYAAAAEMNRYSSSKLIVDDPSVRNLPISGLFQAGDSLSFANAVANTYALQVTERGQQIVLSRQFLR